MGKDPPKSLKIHGFQPKVMSNDLPKSLKIVGFLRKVIGNDLPKALKILDFWPKVMGNDLPKSLKILVFDQKSWTMTYQKRSESLVFDQNLWVMTLSKSLKILGFWSKVIGKRQQNPVIETTGENVHGNRSGNRKLLGISKRESGIEAGISTRESRNDRGESKMVIETTGENLRRICGNLETTRENVQPVM